MCNAPLTRV